MYNRPYSIQRMPSVAVSMSRPRKYTPEEARQRELARTRRWQANNRPHLRKYARAYRKRTKEIRRETVRAYWHSPKGKKIIRAWNLRKRGFTLELFNKMFAKQKGKCAICGCNLKLLSARHVHADHNHKNGKPRGILCGGCNTGLGFFRDNPTSLRKAISYLRRGE